MTSEAPPITRGQIFGVALGNALEFYDFLVFSFFAVQIGQCFFPATDPHSSLLLALATFGAGFLTRPVGAVVIGGLGDRIGRRPMMLLSFALIGLSTLGVAITPSYATVGLAAPITIILCRLVQGFALGGEVGTSTAFLAEAAPPEKRGWYVSMPFTGQGFATLSAGLIGVLVAALMSDSALSSWGWRIAMAIGAATVPVGLALRRTLPETLPAAESVSRPPPLRSYAGVLTFAFLAMLSGTIGTYVLNYMTTFAKATLGMPSSVALGATIAVGLGNVVGAMLGGRLSDVHGRRPWMIWPMLAMTLGVMPGFWLLVGHPTATMLYAIGFVLRLLLAIATASAFIAVTEALPMRVRSGAVSIVYALAISIFGGSTQFVVAWLTGVTGSPLAPAWYMLASALVGLTAMAFARETAPAKAAASA
ncbi:MAG: MFS transporter [Sphingomonas sp.]|uniref:MFS transporter n=1 Tax=Sphingomonas sp. TaxID=28214 RepID=UPI00120F46C8|nr:MFS transporter [Sphingomonas sp.]THD35217.1 MAG: MFS transporter [Sphingomonas sp.]